ncbi:MAG: trehalase, partial [Bacteroidetes bacterium]
MQSYDTIFGELFLAVQTSGIFEDSKTFVDMKPRFAAEVILEQFNSKSNEAGFDLKSFVLEHFEMPEQSST